MDCHPSHIFNPHAKICVPRNRLDKHDDSITIMISFLMTIFFLLVLFLTFIANNNDDVNPKDALKKIKNDNPHNVIIGQLNVKSIRLKFEFLKEVIGKNIDIFLISETKLNETFPSGQFRI